MQVRDNKVDIHTRDTQSHLLRQSDWKKPYGHVTNVPPVTGSSELALHYTALARSKHLQTLTCVKNYKAKLPTPTVKSKGMINHKEGFSAKPIKYDYDYEAKRCGPIQGTPQTRFLLPGGQRPDGL